MAGIVLGVVCALVVAWGAPTVVPVALPAPPPVVAQSAPTVNSPSMSTEAESRRHAAGIAIPIGVLLAILAAIGQAILATLVILGLVTLAFLIAWGIYELIMWIQREASKPAPSGPAPNPTPAPGAPPMPPGPRHPQRHQSQAPARTTIHQTPAISRR